MSTVAEPAKVAAPSHPRLVPGVLPIERLPLEAFLNRVREHPDGLKHEWKSGEEQIGEMSMQQHERVIVRNLLRLFAQTAAYRRGADLLPETDCYLPATDALRRPDLAFFTAGQIRESVELKNPVPAFVIEIISRHDVMTHHDEKLQDYFASGVQVVWHVLPQLKMVRIFRSLTEVTVASGDTPCTAAPAVPDFPPTAEEIFRLPVAQEAAK